MYSMCLLNSEMQSRDASVTEAALKGIFMRTTGLCPVTEYIHTNGIQSGKVHTSQDKVLISIL